MEPINQNMLPQDTTNLQDTSISNNEKRKSCFIKKTYSEEDPECCEPY